MYTNIIHPKETRSCLIHVLVLSKYYEDAIAILTNQHNLHGEFSLTKIQLGIIVIF